MKHLFTLILFSCIILPYYSQSDDCITATPIISSSVCTSPLVGTTSGATQSMPGCLGAADDDVWYQFVASYSSAFLTVSPSANFDAVVQVFDGTCSSLNSLYCIDQSNSGGDELIHMAGLNVGSTYYFRVYDYFTNVSTPTFSVCLIQTAPPINDNCSSATVVASSSVCSSPIINSSFGATESMLGCAGSADDDIWYKFVATSISHSLTVVGSSGIDAVFQIFSGSCGSLTSLQCVDNVGAGSLESLHIGGLTIGNTYYFRVYSYYSGSTATDNFTICLTDAATPPANDDCIGAIAIPVTSNCNVTNTALTSVDATQSMPGCAGNADDDVWCKFVAANANETINVFADASTDAVIELFTGSCSSLTSLYCRDYSGTGQTESLNANTLTVGQTYYFRIYDYYSTGGHTFTVSIVDRELTASASSTTICLGNQVTLTASGTPTFMWSNGVTNGVAFSPTTTTVYNVSGIGTGSCVNTASVTVNVSAPQTPNICLVTIDTLNLNNVIYWDKSSYSNVDSMIIYREVLANIYQRIGAVNQAAFSRFIDTARNIGFRNGDPNVRSYKYKLQMRDSCGNYSALSSYHTSLFLNNNAAIFTWDFYDIEAQSSPVNNYELYRDDNNTGVYNLIGTVTATLGVSSYTFTDVNYSNYASTGRWGVAADGFSCFPSFKGNGYMSPYQQINKSKSNVKNNFTIPQPPNDPTPQSVKELNSDFYIKLIPNPANDYFSIESAVNFKKINIYNSIGELVYDIFISKNTEVNIAINNLSNGIYSVEIISDKGRSVKKLVISR